MEKPSGLKECPRCGLKNRSGAGQCDFCGWDFNAATDEWINQVADLEKVSRVEEETKLDGRVKSRIELTMRDPSNIPAKEPATENKLEVPPPLALESPGDLLTAATLGGMPEPMAETAVEPMAEPVAEVIAEPVVEPIVEPVPEPEPEPLPEPPAPILESPPAPEPAPEVAPVKQVEELPEQEAKPEEKRALSPYIVPSVLIAIGLAIYGLAIFLTVASDISRILGWVLAIIASIGLVVGTIRLWPLVKKVPKAEENEVVLCPVCHEVVSETDTKCPSCGVKFKGP